MPSLRQRALGGISVLILVALRLGLRSEAVAPAEGSVALAWLAKATHWAFYALLVIVPPIRTADGLRQPDIGKFHQWRSPSLSC